MCVLVAQSYLTLWDLVDCNPQASLSMEFSKQEYWSGLPFPSPRGSSWPRDQTQVSCTAGGFFLSHQEAPFLILHLYFLLPTLFLYFPSSLFSLSFSVSLCCDSAPLSRVTWSLDYGSSSPWPPPSSCPSSTLWSYSPHRVSFHNLTQTLLLLCATPSSSFWSHWEQSVALTMVRKALGVWTVFWKALWSGFLALLTLPQHQKPSDYYGNFPRTFQLWVFYKCSSVSLQTAIEFILTSSHLCPHVTLSERSMMTLHKITPPITLNPPFYLAPHFS